MDKETFYKDAEAYNGPLSHVSKEIIDSGVDEIGILNEIDRLYGVASRLSAQNRERHRRIILSLSVTGTLLTLFFLLYDGAEIHCLILVCIIIIFFLYIILRVSDTLKCHDKYLEYRLLAESLRVQFFLSIASVEKPVTELLPWFVRQGASWIIEVIGTRQVLAKDKKKPILDFWIINQIEYHTNAAEKERKKLKKEKIISSGALYVTVTTFFILLIFEYCVYFTPLEINNGMLAAILNALQSHGLMMGCDQTEMLRAFLKIIIGTMSAATLFIGSYYGKMSLEDSINDHERMKELYESTKEKMRSGETDELIIDLARQFLIENSVWYAYQNQNKADFVF